MNVIQYQNLNLYNEITGLLRFFGCSRSRVLAMVFPEGAPARAANDGATSAAKPALVARAGPTRHLKGAMFLGFLSFDASVHGSSQPEVRAPLSHTSLTLTWSPGKMETRFFADLRQQPSSQSDLGSP